jgi:hypothetical protein
MSNKELVKALKSRSSMLMDKAAERLVELDILAKSLQRQNAELQSALRQICEVENKALQIAREALE